MFLQRLIHLEKNLVNMGELHPVQDFARSAFHYLLMLDADGRVKRVVGPRREGKREIPHIYDAPHTERSRGKNARLLGDSGDYVLSIQLTKKDPDTGKEKTQKPKDVAERHVDFKRKLLLIRDAIPSGTSYPGFDSVLKFYGLHADSTGTTPFEEFMASPLRAEITDPTKMIAFATGRSTNPDVVFLTKGLDELLVDVRFTEKPREVAQCSITGEMKPVGRLHGKIKGVVGSGATVAAIVTANQDVTDSFGLSGFDNSPVSEGASRGYYRALNWLLQKRDGEERLEHHIRLQDQSIVCWYDRPGDYPSLVHVLQGEDESGAATEATIKSVVMAATTRAPSQSTLARFDEDNENARAFMIGLKMNAGRPVVTMWGDTPVKDAVARVSKWYNGMELVRTPLMEEKGIPSFHTVRQMVLALDAIVMRPRSTKDAAGDTREWFYNAIPDAPGQRKRNHKKLPAGLKEIERGLMLSAINDRWVDERVLVQAIDCFLHTCQRVRSQVLKERVPFDVFETLQHRLVSLAKLVLIRTFDKDITVALNPDNKDIAYNLGRLFAAFESTQYAYDKEINTTIAKSLGGVMQSPANYLPALELLNKQHLTSLRKEGKGGWYANLIGEIYDNMNESERPVWMSPAQQGTFMVGYHHQRSVLLKKKEPNDAKKKDTESELTAESE